MTKKIFKGKVVSNGMQKTVSVDVERPKKHPIYRKNIRNNKKFLAHTDMDLKIGDIVFIEETRPYSKKVTWKVTQKLEDN